MAGFSMAELFDGLQLKLLLLLTMAVECLLTTNGYLSLPSDPVLLVSSVVIEAATVSVLRAGFALP